MHVIHLIHGETPQGHHTCIKLIDRHISIDSGNTTWQYSENPVNYIALAQYCKACIPLFLDIGNLAQGLQAIKDREGKATHVLPLERL